MKISRENKPAKTLVNKLKKKDISLKHKLQRREGCWNRGAKALLIDSLIRGYLVNPIYMIEETDSENQKKQYVIDGVQRLSTLRSYCDDEFPLSKDLEPVVIRETEYQIAGKKYSSLDDAVRDELDGAQITTYEITEYTDKDVREMFRRLNSGKGLNTSQKLTPDMSDELSDAISEITSLPFFEKRLSGAQLNSSVDQAIALEILMLCATTKDNEFTSFTGKDRKNFIKYYNDKVESDKISLIKDAVNKLDASLEDEVKIPKTSISVLCYASYRMLKDKKSYEKFALKVVEFITDYDNNTEYKDKLSNGTNSSEAVKYRFAYWRNILKEIG